MDCACSRVGVITTVGSVIPRFIDGGSYFRTLSGGGWGSDNVMWGREIVASL